MDFPIYDVSSVNIYLKDKFDTDPLLSSLCIRGELSNYKVYPSGHHYFTLKDAESSLRCVMFRSSASRLRFRPENGMKVITVGRITVYPRDGAYQLYCENMTPDGVGDLHVAYEQLKQKLQAEGLFDLSHKKPLPEYPHRIAIITSSAGAAVHDMLRILGKRYPLSRVMLLPVRVQGEEAPGEIAAAIRYANLCRIADVIITGRGGGSIEDLWAFNDERVARAIYSSEIPVVSAVGHEPDVTISDFVADLRAATPSNAAELVAPDSMKLRERLQSFSQAMAQALDRKLRLERQRLTSIRNSRSLQSPMNYINDRRLHLDNVHGRLTANAERLVRAKREHFVAQTSKLDAMSPLKVFSRGYSMTQKEDGTLLCSTRDAVCGEKLQITVSDGKICAEVCSVQEE